MNTPLPVIDPRRFFRPLEPLGYRDPAAMFAQMPGGGAGMFQEHGYIPGTDGAMIATGHTWCRRVTSNPNEYDFSVTVIHCPTHELAKQTFETETVPARGIKVLKGSAVTPSADESALMTLGPIRVLNLRFANYFVKAGAVVSANGGIKSDADAEKYFLALDREISSVLGSI